MPPSASIKMNWNKTTQTNNEAEVDLVSLADLEIGIADSIHLDIFTSDIFTGNLHHRFFRDYIYTYMDLGLLISVNPYKPLSIYSEQVRNAYRKIGPFQLPPHIYGVCWLVVNRNVSNLECDQVLIFNGESGSGKSQQFNFALQFLTDFSDIGRIVLSANFILNCFGNAKTCRNEDASRFGKLVDLEVDFKGNLISAYFHTYLLEKWRVTSFGRGERNFHVFYALLYGADNSTIKSCKLHGRSMENYKLLGKLNENKSFWEGQFVFLKNCLEDVGLISLEIFKIIACILKLGNINFIPVSNIDGSEGTIITNPFELDEISELLAIDKETLPKLLLYNDKHELTHTESKKIRDSLISSIYFRFFTYLTNMINERINKGKLRCNNKISLLDFYGFEIFENNSLEQFIINFTNEKLQQVFVDLQLKLVQEEYVKNGIKWISVDTREFESDGMIDIVEKNSHGLLQLLTEASLVACEDSSELLQETINASKFSSRHFELAHNSFRLRHYAGTVNYDLNHFVDKNRENLHWNIPSILFQTGNSILQLLFPEGPSPHRRLSPLSTNQLRTNLTNLLNLLSSKKVYTIRCIKPNELTKPNSFELSLVKHQVKYHRLLDYLRVYKEGWAYCFNCYKFMNRFKLLSLITWPNYEGEARDAVKVLLRDLMFQENNEFVICNNNVFLKTQRIVSELEDFRKERMDDLALLIQKTWRGFNQKVKYHRMRRSQIKICRKWRSFLIAKKEREIALYKFKIKAIQAIQDYYIQWKRRMFLHQLITSCPSVSPIGRDWPITPHYIADASTLLRKIFHKWRCAEFRNRICDIDRNRMWEKVTASILFKDYKKSYLRSVSHPFIGDYIRLRQNSQWRRMLLNTVENCVDHCIVFADLINKVTRSAGKFVPIVLVVSTRNVLILDPRTLNVKYKLNLSEVAKISASPFNDDIAVIHMKQNVNNKDELDSNDVGALPLDSHCNSTGCSLFSSTQDNEENEIKNKGDIILHTCHLIEMVTKIYLVIKNASGNNTPIAIKNQFSAQFGNEKVDLLFKTTSSGTVENSIISPSQMKITRKSGRMEFSISQSQPAL